MSPARPTGLSGLRQITDHLYLSSGSSANDLSQLTGNKITSVINVSDSGPGCPPPDVEYVHIPALDTPDFPLGKYFDEVADRVHSTAERGGRTLLHCNAGVSRSAALCMAYLMKHHGVTLLEAHAWVKRCRPIVRPNNGFWKQLIQYEEEIRGSVSVRMVPSSMGEIPDIYEEQLRNMTPL